MSRQLTGGPEAWLDVELETNVNVVDVAEVQRGVGIAAHHIHAQVQVVRKTLVDILQAICVSPVNESVLLLD